MYTIKRTDVKRLTSTPKGNELRLTKAAYGG